MSSKKQPFKVKSTSASSTRQKFAVLSRIAANTNTTNVKTSKGSKKRSESTQGLKSTATKRKNECDVENDASTASFSKRTRASPQSPNRGTRVPVSSGSAISRFSSNEPPDALELASPNRNIRRLLKKDRQSSLATNDVAKTLRKTKNSEAQKRVAELPFVHNRPELPPTNVFSEAGLTKGSAPQRLELIEFPSDFSVKDRASFFSTTSFSWLNEDVLQNVGASALALLTGKLAHSNVSDEARFAASLYYYRSPSRMWSNGPGESTSDFQSEWESSLRSAFSYFCAGHADSFLVSHKLFSITFLAPHVGPNQSDCAVAVFGNSSSGLRSVLTQANVHFILPFQTESMKKERMVSENEELVKLQSETKDESSRMYRAVSEGEMKQGNSGGGAAAWRTLLVVCEKTFPKRCAAPEFASLDRLVDFLVNYKWPEDCDAPRILSSFPFLLATLDRVIIRANTAVRRAVSSLQGDSGLQSSKQQQVQYKLELSGPLLPLPLRALCDILVNRHSDLRGQFAMNASSYCFGIPFSDTSELMPDLQSFFCVPIRRFEKLPDQTGFEIEIAAPP